MYQSRSGADPDKKRGSIPTVWDRPPLLTSGRYPQSTLATRYSLLLLLPPLGIDIGVGIDRLVRIDCLLHLDGGRTLRLAKDTGHVARAGRHVRVTRRDRERRPVVN